MHLPIWEHVKPLFLNCLEVLPLPKGICAIITEYLTGKTGNLQSSN